MAIEGLTIIINGDATPFKRAMGDAKAEGTMLRKHLETVNKQLKFDPGSTVLLTKRQQLLGTALAQNAGHLARLQQMNAKFSASASELTAAQQRQWMQVQRRMGEVELEYAKLRQQAIQYGAAASEANIAAQARFRGLQDSLSKVSGALVTMSAVTGVIGGLSVLAAAQFESSFAGVRKTIIATKAEYDELAASTRRIALEKPISVNDVNEIMMYAGQLGIANRYLADFAATMADLDVATDMDLEEGSMQLARFMNIVGMSQADVDRLGATIVDLGNNSATTESQIMSMAMRIAGSGSNIGLSAQNVLALATSLSSVGIQAEMGGNAISTIMNRIDKAVALDQKSLSTWAATAGMTTEEFKYNWSNNVQDTLLAVIKGMGAFRDEGGNLNVLLKDLGISYMRQVDTMQRLSRAGQLTEDMFARANTAWASNTALVREATQRYDTAESKVKMMGNALYDAGITIGQAILPSFKDIVIAVTDAVQAFGSMDEGTRATIVNIGGVVTATGLAVKAMELTAGGIGRVTEAYSQLKTWLVFASEGSTKYTAQLIAQASSYAGDAIAAKADAEATRDSALAKAQAAARIAENARALGLSKAAQAADAVATSADAAAQAADAEATALNGAAKLQAAGKTSIFAAAQQFLTGRTLALATALGVSNGMLIAMVAAAAACGLALWSLAKAADPMNELTEATKTQKREVDEARARYERLSSTLGEHADETVKAKAAYEDLNVEYQEAAETVGEFQRRMGQVVIGLREVRDGVDEATAEADSSAGRILNAAEGIQRFKDATDDAGKAQLLGYVSDLTGQIDGLDLTMADCIEQNEYFDAAMQKAAEAARKVRFENAYEQFGTLTAAIGEAESAMDELRGQYEWLADGSIAEGLAAAGGAGYGDRSGMWIVAQQYQSLADEAEGAKSQLAEVTGELERNADKTDIYKTAIRYANDANTDLASACRYLTEEMGLAVDESEVLAYKEEQAAIAAAEESDAFEELAEKVDGLVAATPALAGLLADAGATSTGIARYLSDAGISFDDFEKGIEDMVSKSTDALDRLDTHTGTTIWDLIGNLEANASATQAYGDNMAIIWDRYGKDADEGTRLAIEKLQELGPEYGAAIQSLVDGGDDAWAAWKEQVVASTTAGVDASLKSVGLYGDKLKEAQTKAMEDAYGSSNAAASAGAAESAAIAEEGLGNQASAFARGASALVDAASGAYNRVGDAATAINKHSNSTYGWGKHMVEMFKAGMFAARVESAANAVADTVKRILHFSLPDEGPLREGGGPRVWMADMVDEMIAGMRSREGALSAQSGRLAMALRDPLQTGFEKADWGAAATASESHAVRLANESRSSVYAPSVTVNVEARTDADPEDIAAASARRVKQILVARGQ